MSKGVVLVVEDDPLQRRLVREHLAEEGYAVLEASTRGEALEAAGRGPVEVAVIDYRLGADSGLDVLTDLRERNPLLTPIVVTAFGNIENAVEAVKRGAYDYLVKPIDFEKLRLAVERGMERHTLRREVTLLREKLDEKFSARNFIAASGRMEEVSRLIARAAASDATVLISGETGTGKDLAARTIHFASRRKDGPLLVVNIPALPETLVEAELFGAEKGAYTGANERKIGKFEAAAGGTLVLDEIGDLPFTGQVKLLRFLQEREFFRLGSSQPLRSDVRIIAATNRDLAALLADGTFRSDLYYRLNVIHIPMPPLRERREEIPTLVDLFIRKYAEREGKAVDGISREAMAALMAHSFPGNIRELENAVERAVVFADGPVIRAADLPVFVRGKGEADLPEEGLALTDRVARLEKREIRRAMAETGGVKSKAARLLGITERMLGYKIKIYGLDKPAGSERKPGEASGEGA